MQTECLKVKVILKLADPKDLPDLFTLVDKYNGGFDIERKLTKNNLREVLYMQGVFLGYFNDRLIGGVAGYAVPSLFKNEITYCAMFIFIMPEFRHLTKQFIAELELALLGTKVSKLVFGLPTDEREPEADKIRRFFKILGYKELETHYYKRFA